MSGKRTRERRTSDLRLNFFSTLTTTTSLPTKKWIVSPQVTKATHATRHNVRFYVQCDCACK